MPPYVQQIWTVLDKCLRFDMPPYAPVQLPLLILACEGITEAPRKLIPHHRSVRACTLLARSIDRQSFF
jgi:hypothetical protein